MTRPFFEPKSNPISRPMKPRRSQSHIPNCASCCSKSTAADTQWKIPDMCVRGCRIASMWFNYKDERRLALGTTWCKVNLYFVRSCFILYQILCIWHLHVHGDQSDYYEHIYVYSLLFWQDCVNFMALPIVVYIRQSAMDALVGSVIFIVRPDGVRVAIDNGIYWSALNLDGRWAREAGFHPVWRRVWTTMLDPPHLLESLEGTSHSPLECLRYPPHPAPIVVSLQNPNGV